MKIKFTEQIFKSKENEVIDIFHVHLITNDGVNELRIFYNPNNFHFDHILSEWLKRINWSNIGQHFNAIDIKDSDVHQIDFSESNVIGEKSGSNQFLNGEKYISIELDLVKFFRKPDEKKVGSAEFYLNENGFNLVSEFYSVLLQDQEQSFSYSRMLDVSDSYQIGGVTFNPEFNFYSRDSRSENQSTIHKEPKFQLSFNRTKTEKEVLQSFKLLSVASSFFYTRAIDFTTARIHLSDHIVVIKKKSLDLTDKSNKLGVWPVYRIHDIDKFYKKITNTSILDENYLKRLELIVRKFNQSHLVDVRSSILLKFAILEICKSGGKKASKPEQFNFVENGNNLSNKERNKLLNQARDILLEKLNESEKLDFINKWTSSIDKIIVKPMRSPFVEYLESLGFKPDTFGVDFSKIKDIRDSITHGSTEKFTLDELTSCNHMLHRISIGLILHQLRIDDWIEDLDMSI